MGAVLIDETHRWPEGRVVFGVDLAKGPDRAASFVCHVENTTRIWLDDEGWHRTYWSRAKARRDAKRFIREEVARRRMERRVIQ